MSLPISYAERNWFDEARVIEPYDLRGTIIYDTACWEFALDVLSCYDEQTEVVGYHYQEDEPIAIFARQIPEGELAILR